MYKTLSTLFVLLTMTIGSGAIAGSSDESRVEMVAFAQQSYLSSQPYEKQESVIRSMGTGLSEYSYEIQQEASIMQISVDSPIGDVWASFQDFEGSFKMLNKGTDRDLASIEVNAGSMTTDNGLVGMMLRSESFLDVENFPSMNFVGSRFEWYGDRHAVLTGNMTIKDTTRQIAFYVELVDANVEDLYSERVTLKATATIKRSEFGIHTLLPVVSDDVNLYISIDALRYTSMCMM